MKKESKRKWLKLFLWFGGIAGLLCIIAISIFAYLFYDLINNPFNDQKFDETIWKEFHQNDDPDNPRGNMAYHLRDRVLKDGMNMQEVRSLLGIPDYSEGKDFMRYNLGMWSGFRIDPDSFDIHFDEHGGISHIEIIQH